MYKHIIDTNIHIDDIILHIIYGCIRHHDTSRWQKPSINKSKFYSNIDIFCKVCCGKHIHKHRKHHFINPNKHLPYLIPGSISGRRGEVGLGAIGVGSTGGSTSTWSNSWLLFLHRSEFEGIFRMIFSTRCFCLNILRHFLIWFGQSKKGGKLSEPCSDVTTSFT